MKARAGVLVLLLCLAPFGGAWGQDQVRQAIRRLESEDDSERCSAAVWLGERGASTPRVGFALIAALRDPSPGVREAAVEGLGRLRIRPATRQVARALLDLQVGVQVKAAAALHALRPVPADVVLPKLEPLLSQAGPLTAETTGAWHEMLLALLASVRPLRLCLPQLLGCVGPLISLEYEGRSRLWLEPLLEGRFGDSWSSLQPEDFADLSDALLRERDPARVTFLLKVLHKAVDAKGAGANAATAVPGLAATLRHGKPEHRSKALLTIRCMGPAGAPTTPVLLRLLSEEKGELRSLTAVALGSVGTAECVAPLCDYVRAERWRLHFGAGSDPLKSACKRAAQVRPLWWVPLRLYAYEWLLVLGVALAAWHLQRRACRGRRRSLGWALAVAPPLLAGGAAGAILATPWLAELVPTLSLAPAWLAAPLTLLVLFALPGVWIQSATRPSGAQPAEARVT